MKRFIKLFAFLFCFCGLFAQRQLVVLHTNDTHSQIEPTSKESPNNPDRGGVARREVLINQQKALNPDLLLLDAGDFCQGTPFFNVYKGEVEVRMMNILKYDACELGNHEFDNGVESLAKVLKQARFAVLCANYDVSKTVLKGLVKPYTIIERGGLKIGIIGIGVNPKGLIPQNKFAGIIYNDPIETANRIAQFLKSEKKCDVIIVLSHLGYNYEETGHKIGDRQLAAKSRNIDLIIGGHSHTFMKKPEQVKNLDGKDVVINQAGKQGIVVDKIELEWNEKK